MDECLIALGRNNGPHLLFDLYYLLDLYHPRVLDLARPDMAGVVADVWCAAEYPQRAMDCSLWRRLFQDNGYSHDGTYAETPTKAVKLYRGCEHQGRHGMSWTSDLAIARQFAVGGLRGRPAGHVYVAEVEPELLLAFIGTSGRDESEYVIDPMGLTDENVTLFEAAQR